MDPSDPAEEPADPSITGPVFDAHVDSIQRALDLGHDLGREGPGQLDLVRGRRGGLRALVLVAWVDPVHLPHGARARARALLAEVHALARRHPRLVALVGNGRELAQAHTEGRIGVVAGIEGGHALEEGIDDLLWFFERGVRVLTLVWNNHLPWARSCADGATAAVPAGLSPLGRRIVREMNRLGMLVDLSHAGERTFHDALEASSEPVIASHSGCRALHDHPRNLGDAQLRALAANGGVVGIVFHPGFLDAGARAEEERVRATPAYRTLGPAVEGVAASPAHGAPGLVTAEATRLFLAQSEHLQAAATPLSAERVVDHVVHAAEVAGIDHVGLGSDYDGIQRAPAGLEDASCYGFLAERLLARGLAPGEVRQVLGGNLERVFARATREGTRAWSAPILPLRG